MRPSTTSLWRWNRHAPRTSTALRTLPSPLKISFFTSAPKNTCGKGECERTYHITDLSKGAMRVTDASSSPALRYERYKRWYPLLCEEIKLVARPNAPIIPVGYVVRDFLTVQKTSDLKAEILHYSQSAGPHRTKMPKRYPEQFSEFKDTVDLSDIKKTAKRVLGGAGLGPGEPENTLKRLQRGKGLTKSRKQLMFTYKCQFEKLLGADAQSP